MITNNMRLGRTHIHTATQLHSVFTQRALVDCCVFHGLLVPHDSTLRTPVTIKIIIK